MMHRSCCHPQLHKTAFPLPLTCPHGGFPCIRDSWQPATVAGGHLVWEVPRGAERRHRGTPPSSRSCAPWRKRPDRSVTFQSTHRPRAGGHARTSPLETPLPQPSDGSHFSETLAPCQPQIPPEISEESWAERAPLSAGQVALLAASPLPVLSLLWRCELLTAHSVLVCDKRAHK